MHRHGMDNAEPVPRKGGPHRRGPSCGARLETQRVGVVGRGLAGHALERRGGGRQLLQLGVEGGKRGGRHRWLGGTGTPKRKAARGE